MRFGAGSLLVVGVALVASACSFPEYTIDEPFRIQLSAVAGRWWSIYELYVYQ